MTDEAKLEEGSSGLRPAGAGWFVVNVDRAAWMHSDRFGSWCGFEGEQRFGQIGINVHVLQPGQAACMYHEETLQEDFMVLAGECLLLVEEEERRLRAWDFFHCPPGTKHVFVGAGDGPCAILMIGARAKEAGLFYPVSELAGRHGASVAAATPDPREAYASVPAPRPIDVQWPLTES